MPSQPKFTNPKDKQIYDVHRRFIRVMEEQRLSTISDQTKDSYLAVLTSLADKLEIPGKPLGEIVREMMAEAAPLLFQTMQN